LEAKENVYLVQLSWKGGARLVLEERCRSMSNPSDGSHHSNVCETLSDPQGGSNRLTPGKLSKCKNSI